MLPATWPQYWTSRTSADLNRNCGNRKRWRPLASSPPVLLTIIIGHASIQLAKANVDQEVTKSLEQVRLAGERASGLTRQLLAFSRKQILNRYSSTWSSMPAIRCLKAASCG